jgi:hypothetical protein
MCHGRLSLAAPPQHTTAGVGGKAQAHVISVSLGEGWAIVQGASS